jgi:hypothetical protein
VAIVLKSGCLNLLEPSGPVTACNGIALPLPLPILTDISLPVMCEGIIIKTDSLHVILIKTKLYA